jgi:hypothetical protein
MIQNTIFIYILFPSKIYGRSRVPLAFFCFVSQWISSVSTTQEPGVYSRVRVVDHRAVLSTPAGPCWLRENFVASLPVRLLWKNVRDTRRPASLIASRCDLPAISIWPIETNDPYEAQ